MSELRLQEPYKVYWALLAGHPSVWDYLHHGRQRVEPLTEHLTLLSKGNQVLHGGPDAEELAYFIEGTAQAWRRAHTTASTHGGIAWFDATVILLPSMIELAVGSVEHITAQYLMKRTRGRVMPIGRHPLWLVVSTIDSLREKALGGIHLSLLASHRIN